MKALVTRPHADAATLVAALAARGIEPVLEPLLVIRTLEDGVRRLPPVLRKSQAVLFTSANGVRAFAAATQTRNLPAFAVGHATAAAARAVGFPLVMSAGGTVADLARLVIDRLRPIDGALVHAAGRDVAGDLSGALATAGFILRRIPLYEAVTAPQFSAAAAVALAERRIAYALFFSPRTAATFVRLVIAAGLGGACRDIAGLALSPAVATALEAVPWRELRIAATPDEPALIAALDRVLVRGIAANPPVGRQEASA